MNKEVFEKFETFVKTALEEIADLKQQLSSLNEKEAAEKEARDEEFEHALKQAAASLYDSDFINDDYDKRRFIKRAKEDHKYLAEVIQKICQASDVSAFGSVANVKTAGDLQDDPVMRKAFGYDVNYNLLDE
jgi:FtsZ-binding cell division protein ZapB